ncbi:hypothetical protein M2319_001184 [Rhodobium gokarnense]|uniref:Uncharacterized protein n=1 Tax=Rhodobium gokarnense TaxID=364296 RepID=A0ABT3H8Y6_9HYPH|nr:hypothetical protein [Rhodobium gokarnense]
MTATVVSYPDRVADMVGSALLSTPAIADVD